MVHQYSETNVQTTDHIIYDCTRLKEEKDKLRAAVNKKEN
jgi:hypothetical protein